MVLIIGKTTREDTDWVPFEIRYVVDECRIPTIAAYPNTSPILVQELPPPALPVEVMAQYDRHLEPLHVRAGSILANAHVREVIMPLCA